MTRRSRGRPLTALALLLLGSLAALLAPSPGPALAEEEPSWHLEPVLPPHEPGLPEANTPIGLGRVADIEFWAPNRGLLITAGNSPTIAPGVWAYDGVGWHELSDKCGATDGRIGWAGADEFWTVSDGRPGQAETEGSKPPLADNTLCHFSGGSIVGSYASLAFRPASYQPMHGAACLGPADCWFGGDILPKGQVGSFHLHWDGGSLTAVPNPQGRAVMDMRRLGDHLFESVRITGEDQISPPESATEPSALHTIAPTGVSPTFASLHPETQTGQPLPVFSPEEFPTALDFLHLAADENALWGAANPVSPPPAGSAPGEVTILHQAEGVWSQVLGASTDPPGGNPFTKFTSKELEGQNLLVTSIAANPGTETAWLALDTKADSEHLSPVAHATVARISAGEVISGEQTLPSPAEEEAGIGPKGGAERITCPSTDNCWLATTQGWLFHLSDEAHRHLARDTDPAFAGIITYRPPDQGIPPVVPDAPPVDDSGLPGEHPALPALEPPPASTEGRIPVALLSHIKVRVLHKTTLQLSFHLAVRARLRLTAKRRNRVVGRTRMMTLAAGNRRLLLRLDLRRWPTKLTLESHALAPLPTESTRSANVGTLSTGATFLPRLTGLGRSGPKP
jgi:hypothetical protein